MKAKFIAILCALLLTTATLSACDNGTGTSDSNSNSNSNQTSTTQSNVNAIPANTPAYTEMFSSRDFEVGYSNSEAVFITLADNASTTSDDTGVNINGNIITITKAGSYVFSGQLSEGQIVVNTTKEDKVQLVLNGVSITAKSIAPIYVKQSDKVFVTLIQNTTNTLATTADFVAIDEYNIDGVIFARSDLTLNGSGKLAINSASGHGVVSKDDLVITSGTYDINASSHAFQGKDSIRIADGTFNVVSGKDGFHAENADDVSLGFVYIKLGSFNITANGDGITAGTTLGITDGSFNITTKANTTDASNKGIKSTGDMNLYAGTFVLNTADDAIHSNANLTVSGGTYTINAKDDGFHSDTALTIDDGKINITQCYEGLEGKTVTVNGGDINITASDDGINAADSSVKTGGAFGGKGGPMGVAVEDVGLTINGGNIVVNASGDGIDSNGALNMNGGTVFVSGSQNGGNAAFDYDGSAKISGGTIICVGMSQMAQNFGTDSTQGAMLVNLTTTQTANTSIVLKNASGKEILTYTAPKSYNSVLISSPEIKQGETYTLVAGTETQIITMDSLIYGSGFSMGGGFGGGKKPNGFQRPGNNNQIPAMPDGEMPALPNGEIPEMPNGETPNRPTPPNGIQIPESTTAGEQA